MLIRDMVKAELDKCREECNFTIEERIYFEAKASDESNIRVGFNNFWSESKTAEISRRVRAKIQKVLRL